MSAEKNDESCRSMVSNLPLLFTGGYPTNLDIITEKELENFIPFMVQCSLGGSSNQSEFAEPEWWPEEVPFTNPFSKPPHYRGDWLAKMKEIVAICYEFHKSIFLLRYCNELASYERECLRFINNYNSTTSLYERTSNRLLVTFRNENMLYDQHFQNNRRCLLPRTASSQSVDNTPQMVEPALFDIYLCDNCDAELYSLQAYKEHEKSCQFDDDVIICEPDEPQTVATSDETTHKKVAFLLNMNLQSQHIPTIKMSPQKETLPKGSPEKFRRLPTRQRAVLALSRCPAVPFSSPLGQFLIQKSKSPNIIEDYIEERLERIERFSVAPPLGQCYMRPRWLEKRVTTNAIVTYKKPHEHPPPADYHQYKFPRRQLSTKSRDLEYEKFNSLLLKKCRPFSISLKRLTDRDINMYRHKIKTKRLTNRLSTGSSNINLSKPIKIVEYIDLCSSDDDDDCRSCSSSSIERKNSSDIRHRNRVASNSNNNSNNINGNVLSIPLDTKPLVLNRLLNHNNNNNSGNHILLEKPFNQQHQHIKTIFTATKASPTTTSLTTTNLNNNNNNTSYIITNKLVTTNNRENNIIKITTTNSHHQTGRNMPQLVRISSQTTGSGRARSPQEQRRSLTANL